MKEHRNSGYLHQMGAALKTECQHLSANPSRKHHFSTGTIRGKQRKCSECSWRKGRKLIRFQKQEHFSLGTR